MPLIDGLISLLNPNSLMFLFVGVILFLVFGAIPGIGGIVAYAILIPLTYTMDAVSAFALLVGGHAATMFGGSISAILINAPGTGMNIATCFDGYPLTQQGRAGEALGASATASALGGIVGALILALLIPILREVVLLFGPPEIFLICILGLTTIASISKGSLLKGSIAGFLGILLSFVGFEPVGGQLRYTLGMLYFWDGMPLVPLIVGLFAMAEVLDLCTTGGSISRKEVSAKKVGNVSIGIKACFKHWFLLIRSAVIGTIIGILPGAGGSVAALVTYGNAVSTSKHPEKFGKGAIEGVIAPEAANNAKDAGVLVPTIAFGIPGSESTAILLGAFLIHGLQPGPELLIQHQTFLFSLVWMIVLGGILGSVIGLPIASRLSYLTIIPISLIAPFIIAIAFLGSFSSRGMIEDVFMTLIFCFLGYAMKRYGFPRGPVIIGLILGHIVERNLHLSLQISGWRFILQPLPIVFIILIAIVLFLPALIQFQKNRRKLDED